MFHALLATALLAQSSPVQGLEAQLEGTYPLRVQRYELPNLGKVVIEERRVDPQLGVVIREARDQLGEIVQLDALRLEERRLAIAASGKISHELVPILDAAEGSDPIHVVFWLVEPEGTPDFADLIQHYATVGLDAESARALTLALAEEHFAPGNQAFADVVRDIGGEVDLVGTYWPDVFATLTADQVRTLALRPEVDMAYYAFTEGGPELDHAQATLRTANVHDAGVTGATGPTKVLVNDCGNVPTTHPELPPIVLMNSNSASSHPAGVAGNIGRNHPTEWGAATGIAQLYSADGCGNDALAQTAWTWGLQQGISLGNCSWWNFNKGSIVFLDRYFDYTIRNFSVMMFKSTGNQGNTGTPYTTSPGNGFNMTNSGCYNDGNDQDWSNDVMASFSSYWDPIEGHVKPEVASPGDGVVTTGTSGTQTFGGTSSASPLTTGVATLVANTDPSLLTSMPTLKAALMVGAWHNIEGSPVVSDKDGAGGVHATASHRVVANGQFENGSFTSGDFLPGGFYDKQISLTAGLETRVAALWFSNPNMALTTDQTEMDLDITVLDPNGQVVASAADPFSAWELVQFTPPMSGNYTVRLTRQKFLGTSEPYAIAWSTRLDAAVADVTMTGTPTLGSTVQFHLRDRYDDSNPNYIAVASFGTLPSFIPLQNGWVLPVRLDRLARFTTSGSTPSFMGSLDNQGMATASFKIPNSTSLIGQTIYVSFLTEDSPGNSKMVSPAFSFVVQ